MPEPIPGLTEHQRRVWEAYERLGGYVPVAKELGMTHSAVRWTVERCRIKALRGNVPIPQPAVPNGHYVKGVSTLLDGSGETKGQWVKTAVDEAERHKGLINALEEAFSALPRVPVIPKPKRGQQHLLACYPMGDPHVGLYSWAEETGEDFDLKIAEKVMVDAAQRLVACTPASDDALIVNLGDFFHADTSDNRTLASGHALDVDTRWTKVLRVGLHIMRSIIEAALTKHRRVRVINEIGNHDEHSSQILTLALSALYEKNPRVSFDEAPAHFHYFPFGSTLIGITHGDTVKPEKLGEIMAADRPEEWGKAKFRYWFTGHVHHRRVFELPGCLVESFRTLAAKDAWHAKSGYRSGRDMQAIVIDREFGEVERHRVDVAMVTK